MTAKALGGGQETLRSPPNGRYRACKPFYWASAACRGCSRIIEARGTRPEATAPAAAPRKNGVMTDERAKAAPKIRRCHTSVTVFRNANADLLDLGTVHRVHLACVHAVADLPEPATVVAGRQMP